MLSDVHQTVQHQIGHRGLQGHHEGEVMTVHKNKQIRQTRHDATHFSAPVVASSRNPSCVRAEMESLVVW